MTTRAHECPLALYDTDGTPTGLSGCGSNQITDDGEGYYDCPDCGIWFSDPVELDTVSDPLRLVTASPTTTCNPVRRYPDDFDFEPIQHQWEQHFALADGTVAWGYARCSECGQIEWVHGYTVTTFGSNSPA